MTQITKHKPIISTGFIVAVFLFTPTITNATNTIPIPYTSQAPYANWSQPWQDTCEEASIVMVDNFYQGKTYKKIPKKDAKAQISRLLDIKNKYYGKSLDEDAQEVVDLINNFFNWEARVVENPTLEETKAELDSGRPVIVPVYGKALKNIYFRNGGPDYHMLVLSGYDDVKKQFITKEPGLTTLGLDFRYKYATIMNAMHDFTGKKGQTKNSKQVAIFTQKELTDSALTDADKDGLNKHEEIIFNTYPWSQDTDNDGYSDKIEIDNGFPPTISGKN